MAATSRSLFVMALILGCSSCASASRIAEAEEEVVQPEAMDACLARFEAEVRDSLGSPPTLPTVADAVRWARTHLPSNLTAAFDAAGRATLHAHASNASHGPKLREQLYAATAKQLFAAATDQQRDCKLVIPEKLSQVLYSSLRLHHEPIRSQLAGVGLDDVYEVESSFLLMLTLDASGLSWNERMFAPEE